MLGRKEHLYDIEDVERWCSAHVARHLKETNAQLSYDDRRDLLSFLILQTYERALAYDPVKANGKPFAKWAGYIVYRRIADWYRNEFGDSRYGPGAARRGSVGDHVPGASGASDADDPLTREHDPHDWALATESRLDSEALHEHVGQLSEASRWVIENIVEQRAAGESRQETATRLGLSNRKVDRYLEDLRAEILELADAGQEKAA